MLKVDNNQNKKKECAKNHFSKEEDQRLRNLVFKFGDNNWKMISNFMPGRSSRQCRERYIGYLSPSLSFKPWTSEEDALLIEKLKEIGPKWSKMVPFFEGRSDCNIKNRWYKHLSKTATPDFINKVFNKNETKSSESSPPSFDFHYGANTASPDKASPLTNDKIIEQQQQQNLMLGAPQNQFMQYYQNPLYYQQMQQAILYNQFVYQWQQYNQFYSSQQQVQNQKQTTAQTNQQKQQSEIVEIDFKPINNNQFDFFDQSGEEDNIPFEFCFPDLETEEMFAF